MEKIYLRFLSFVFSQLQIRGVYRFCSALYPYKRTQFQRGVWLRKKYLSAHYNLMINLFSKDLIDHKILFTGVYERGTNSILEAHVKPGDVVVEAGANTGTETLLISRLTGAKGKVLAFEPVPHVVNKLKNNLALNNIENAQVMELALGETRKEISFYVYPENHPNQGMGSKVLENSGLEKITVMQTTLDSLVEDGTIARIDFLKMDVQGAEFDILRGGINCIKKYRPKIFLEAADDLSNLRAIYNYLADLNYAIRLIKDDGELENLNSGNLAMGNWLAIPTDKLS
jgi:FkbM family methyltransferase